MSKGLVFLDEVRDAKRQDCIYSSRRFLGLDCLDPSRRMNPSRFYEGGEPLSHFERYRESRNKILLGPHSSDWDKYPKDIYLLRVIRAGAMKSSSYGPVTDIVSIDNIMYDYF